MSRLWVAALLLAFAAAPAFACPYDSAATDTQKKAVAAQPADEHPTPPHSAAKHKAPT
jgi:hypothetical protein